MLKPEKPYAFKQELRQIHKPNRWDKTRLPACDEFVIKDGITIVLPDYENEVIMTAAVDFADYLRTSMGIASQISDKAGAGQQILVALKQDLGEENGYMGHRLTITDSAVYLDGFDDRGIAQGFYLMEDLMNLRAAPFLQKKTIQRKALFSPRNTQSPLGAFEYTEEALALIAHQGFDAITLWIKGPNQTLKGYLDFNQICDRAKKYGIDVYVDIYMPHTAHPDDPGAQEFYDNMYGELFRKCPGIKGTCIYGEACLFQSRDPRVIHPKDPRDMTANIPDDKIEAGWWPCNDYPKLMAMIQRSIRKYRPDADIILCTYNWGYQPEEDRIKLIEALPEGISLCATWDMFHKFKVGQITQYISDYSLQFVGPGEYFTSEAIAAKKKGLRLYSISNTSGKTWDFGVIPYQPMPYQWIKRYKAILKARKDWGLCGLTENIHYGFYPSFVADLEKWAFFTEVKPMEQILQDILARDFGQENLETVDKAMRIWSEAITHMMPTSADQYSALRIGPAFPIFTTGRAVKMPSPPQAFWGNAIYHFKYGNTYNTVTSLPGVRLYTENQEFTKLRDMLLEGVEVLKTVEQPNVALLKLINMGEFMYRTIVTVLHCRQSFVALTKLHIAGTKENAAQLLDELEAIILAERENVEATIPLVQVDSILGYEPSMDYTTNEECLRWKLKQLDVELSYRIPMLKNCNNQ